MYCYYVLLTNGEETIIFGNYWEDAKRRYPEVAKQIDRLIAVDYLD